ncbi:MAG: hypothetical protein COA96_05565 [SAR86 cluster bacterium]|uniref:Uncharacterized protein n=1 Tax=SAR86 cluster bacterium TaxID=2030880 RepID=A0A2A5B3Z5_9GAMM|nr:MAG: hypothetical protein COA96_05565 [SAR86 cluster bacterium]
MESILREMRAYNIEHQILPGENTVINRILKHSVEMEPVYAELTSKLSECQQINLWDALLGVATFWNPEASKALREEKRKLFKLNREIAKCAKSLAMMIKERRDISEISGISAYEDYHFIHWVNRAGMKKPYYQVYVKKDINSLKSRFDLKYWPDNHEVVAAIGELAQENEVYETDSWTEELLSSSKCSTADYLRVILKAIEDRKENGPSAGLLPEGFRLSDNLLATLINCTLDLSSENLLSSENIKRSRQNIRDRKLAMKMED